MQNILLVLSIYERSAISITFIFFNKNPGQFHMIISMLFYYGVFPGFSLRIIKSRTFVLSRVNCVTSIPSFLKFAEATFFITSNVQVNPRR